MLLSKYGGEIIMNPKELKLAIIITILLLGAVILSVSSTSASPNIRFKGIAERTDAYSSETNKFLFEGVFSTNHWKIKIFPFGRENELGHVEYGFDGTNIFFLEFTNVEPYQIAKQKPAIFINGSVSTNSIPASLTSFIHTYWMAYTLCLNKSISERPPGLPISMLSGIQNTNLLKTRYATGPGGLIDKVELLNTRLIYEASGKSYQQPEPYDKGFVNAEFQVIERRQIDNLNFPIHYEWKVFTPLENGQTPEDLRLIHRLSVKTKVVAMFEEVFSGMPSPPTGSQMVVRDYRMAETSGNPDAIYFSKNGFWNPYDQAFRARIDEIILIDKDKE